jgi:signal transduction histidine kinase
MNESGTAEAPREEPHFDIDATVVKRLGEELISDEVSAIMELVKNSYDADADWVKITISTDGTVPDGMVYSGAKSYITLEDNGDGMTYGDIVSKWLVISLSSKREMKALSKTTPKGRVPLGEKGVGRLSTQRLGRQLELISGVLGSEEQNHLAFDWADFESKIPLTKVRLQHRVAAKKAKQKGTQLIITRLANPDVWKKEAADRFRGQLSQLIFPYKKKRPFNVYLNIDGQKQDLDEISEDLQTQAIGHFDFSFKDNKLTVDGKIRLGRLRGNDNEEVFDKFLRLDDGQDFFAFLTDPVANPRWFLDKIKDNIKTPKGWFFSFHRELSFDKDFPGKKLALTSPDEKAQIANPGDFFGEISDYNLRGTDSTDNVFNDLKQYKALVNNQIGIRIFRDGFGIKPYGFDRQDWLSLGSGQTSGSSFYGLRPNNVIGFVSISMAGNAQLQELTSREGFTETPYSRNFIQLMKDGVVRQINDILESTRRSYLAYKPVADRKITGFQSMDEPVALLKHTSKQATNIAERSQRAEHQFNDLSSTLKNQVTKLQKEPLFASASETTALPLLQKVEGLVNEGASLFNEINKILAEAKKWEELASYVSTQVTDLQSQLSQFSELAGLGLTAEALTHDMYILLDRINTAAHEFNSQINRATTPAPVYEFMEYVRSFSRDLRKQLTHLAPSLRFNREKRESVSIGAFIDTTLDYYRLRFDASGIEFILKNQRDFAITANLGKLTQIFDNLFLNSEYWLRERKRNEPSFSPQLQVEIVGPFVRVSDNGYGIAEHLENTLFQPFITAKPAEIGRGLGLFIVRQLLESMGCDILLLQKRNELNRRYIFQLNLDAASN